MQVLKRLRQSPEDPNDIAAKEEHYQISQQIALDEQKLKTLGRSVWTVVWTKPSYRKRMIMGFLIQWGAEFSGPLIINNYGVSNFLLVNHMQDVLTSIR
jgi:hypothetical protein